MKIFTLKKIGLALLLATGFNAMATDIYDTYQSYNSNSFQVSNGGQIGNEVTLSKANVTLTGFNFEYYTTTFTSANVGVDLRIYLNNGAPFNGYATPGTVLYDSGVFKPLIAAPGGTDVNYGVADFGANFVLPTDFTFTLTFSGLASGDILNLLLANPPSGQIGSTTPDYWYNTGSGWTLDQLSGGISPDLAVQFTGTLKASDSPMTAGLLGLGFVGMFAFRSKFSQNFTSKKI